jgi:hypothetical protein
MRTDIKSSGKRNDEANSWTKRVPVRVETRLFHVKQGDIRKRKAVNGNRKIIL